MANFNEDFLQTIWKYQYFDKNSLETTTGERIEIKKIGFHNFHEGPDFLEAHIKIGKLEYHGHVEIHKYASEWNQHEHQADSRYNSVILHVVWQHDKDMPRQDRTIIPTLELKGRVFLDVLRNYERLITKSSELLCADELPDIPDILKFSMIEKSLVERLEKKSILILNSLSQTNNDWEETAYRWLFQCFGFKTNAIPMGKVGSSVPYKVLQRLSFQQRSLEAILFGQAGLLEGETSDEYALDLQQEYLFQRQKFGLKFACHAHEWKMMGVRPSNFPSIRLAQLVQVLRQNPNLFSAVLHELDNFQNFKKIFAINLPSYWQEHYRFAKKAEKTTAKGLSKDSLFHLAINFVVPLWYTYGKYLQESEWKEKCIDFLQTIPAENNYILRKFKAVNWPVQHAFDSQAMLGLFHNYCSQKKCLDCKIGQNIIKPQKMGRPEKKGNLVKRWD